MAARVPRLPALAARTAEDAPRQIRGGPRRTGRGQRRRQGGLGLAGVREARVRADLRRGGCRAAAAPRADTLLPGVGGLLASDGGGSPLLMTRYSYSQLGNHPAPFVHVNLSGPNGATEW